MSGKTAQTSFERLQELLLSQVKSAEESHITDRVSTDEEEVDSGNVTADQEDDLKAHLGDLAVTEDQTGGTEPEKDLPRGDEQAATTQPLPPESPDHITNEMLADTKKQALSTWKQQGDKLATALGKIAEMLSDDSEEKDEEEKDEEPKKKEEGEAKSEIVAESTPIDADKCAVDLLSEAIDSGDTKKIAGVLSEHSEVLKETAEGFDAAKKVASVMEKEAQDAQEVSAGYEAAVKVAQALVETDEIETQEKQAAFIQLMDETVKQARTDADLLCDYLDAFVRVQDSTTQKAAGVPEELLGAVDPSADPAAMLGGEEDVPDDEELAALLANVLGGGTNVEELLGEKPPEIKEDEPGEEEMSEENVEEEEETPKEAQLDKLQTLLNAIKKLK